MKGIMRGENRVMQIWDRVVTGCFGGVGWECTDLPIVVQSDSTHPYRTHAQHSIPPHPADIPSRNRGSIPLRPGRTERSTSPLSLRQELEVVRCLDEEVHVGEKVCV